MARHDDLADVVDVDVFVAEPHGPCMRPLNKILNWLLRRIVGK
jgi:hypothetical protein